MLGPGPEPFKIQGGSSKHDPRRSRRRSRPILLINRSSVARAVLHNLLHWLTDWLTDSAFSSEPSKHHYTQTVRPRELTVWENVHPPPHITCHVSHVKCHVSGIMCHCQVSGVTCQVSQFVIFFFGQSGWAILWRICYQRGLTCLVSYIGIVNICRSRYAKLVSSCVEPRICTAMVSSTWHTIKH